MEHINFNFEKLKSFKKFFEVVRAGKSCSIFGVQNSLRPVISSAIGKKILFVTADDSLTTSVVSAFETMGKKTCLIPTVPDSFLYKRVTSIDRCVARSQSLFKILSGDFDAVVCTAQSLFSFLPDVSDFLSCIINLAENQDVDVSALEKTLVRSGYKREEIISEKGQFSRRGEVFDIFPINLDFPIRIDFFDTVIESIKVLDFESNKGTKILKKVSICPCTDLLFSDEEFLSLEQKISGLNLCTDDADLNVVVSAQINELVSRLQRKDRDYSLSLLLTHQDKVSSLFDYLDKSGEYLVVIDECKQIYDRICDFSRESSARIKDLSLSKTLIAKTPCFFTEKQVMENIKNRSALAFLKITNSNKFFSSDAVFSFKTSPASKFVHSQKDLGFELKNYLASGYKVYLFAGSEDNAKHLKNLLSAQGISLEKTTGYSVFGEASSIFSAALETGFILPDEKVYVLGTYDIFAKKRQGQGLKIGRENVFTVPKVGDYVVHEFHGIGVCEGVTKLTGNLGTQDYVVVRYRDNDKLYVPTSNMDLLSRFTGAEKPAKLSKIGGADFSAVKEKVKKSVKKLAFDLMELYATREKIKGFAFSEDNALQREFENAFPFTETEDQLTSISEIKKDMESPKVMDRLLCGDVGFGKTEVALRCCFKAIMDGKQVAFIAPTTILSEQHLSTAKSRMFDFGISIEVLNRFRSKKQTDKVLSDLKNGKIDLIFGTHRLLSKDVVFKNLGLIVLDEEQKFGVEDKEKLKNDYPNVDVLTLSATPIPRTLSMSLSGIRDISIISTPPSERLPIQTYVTEYTDSLVKDAIYREIRRDGQVFILFNSVEKIYMFAEKIKKIVPDVSIGIAHGRLPARELEEVIYNFYTKKFSVLICTTIIENGIDIENANTLIVIDSDKLGLSSLYQIRGRVGRGSKMAYAYFTYEYQKSLSEQAYKRLDALSEFCEFGSGFKLAMRDLEIRGGGNIFGAEQSGHLQKVGYDLYSKMLSDAVKELKGESVSEKRDVLVKVKIDAYVPDTYILTSEDRMVAYKRISALSSLDEVRALEDELKQTFGKVPEVVENLMSISLVRQLASKLNAVEINSVGGSVNLVFESKGDILKSEILAEAVFKFRAKCAIDLSSRAEIKFGGGEDTKANFEILKQFLLETHKLLNKKQ